MRRRVIRNVLLAVAGLLAMAAVGVTTAGTPAQAAAPANRLTVEVTGIASAKGNIMAAVCDKASFLKRCAYVRQDKASAAGSVVLHFDGLPAGRVAVMVFHDENGNGQFDKAPNGIPLEGYAFSNNAKGNYGPPSFDDAAITVRPGDNHISVELVY